MSEGSTSTAANSLPLTAVCAVLTLHCLQIPLHFLLLCSQAFQLSISPCVAKESGYARLQTIACCE